MKFPITVLENSTRRYHRSGQSQHSLIIRPRKHSGISLPKPRSCCRRKRSCEFRGPFVLRNLQSVSAFAHG